jgi:hypothetical protein
MPGNGPLLPGEASAELPKMISGPGVPDQESGETAGTQRFNFLVKALKTTGETKDDTSPPRKATSRTREADRKE